MTEHLRGPATLRGTCRVIMATPGGRDGHGGMASLVKYLTDALPERLPGVRIGVIDTYGPGPFWLMPFSFVGALFQLLMARLAGHVDLLHIHMACYGSALRKGLLAVVATAMGVPSVIHLHGAEFDVFTRALPPWRRKLLVWVLRRCVRIVVIGNHWRDVIVQELGIDPAHVVLIHNGAPKSGLSKRITSGTGRQLLMLGELGPRKGTPELIAALATPEVRQREWTATLAGNGPVDEFRAAIESLQLSDRVHLPGWQGPDEVRALLARADILALPSRHEGLPMAILEAMAAGVAIIATPVGAISDAIVDGETGLMVPPGDSSALARAIEMLLDDQALRDRLGASARARFELLFTIDRTADAVAALYRDLGIV